MLSSIIRSLSLKTKLLIISFVLLIYPMLLIGGAGLLYYNRLLRQNFVFYTEKQIEILANRIPAGLEEINQLMLDILYEPEIYNLDKFKETFAGDRQIDSYLRSIVRSNGGVKRAFLQYSSGEKNKLYTTESVVSTNYTDLPESYFSSVILSQIIKSLDENGNLKLISISRSNGNDFLYLASRFYSISDRFDPLGILAFEIDENFLFSQFLQLGDDPVQQLRIINDTGNIIWNQKGGIRVHRQENSVLSQYISEPEGSRFTDEGCLISLAVPETTLELYALSSPTALLGLLQKTALRVLMLCILSIPIFTFLILIFYKNAVLPLSSLLSAMKKVEDGKFGETLKCDRTDEIGVLIESFNSMSEKISTLIRTVYEEEIELQNARIKALQTQMNPHFLFNTLEAINWRAIMDGQDEISEMIQALASITSARIDRGNERFVSFRQERKFIENYYLLLKKRYGEKLTVSIEMEPLIETFRIPRLILQPIVENALVHGVEQRGEGSIGIRIFNIDDSISITINDNGPGICDSRLAEIHDILEESTGEFFKNNNSEKQPVALVNIKRRLELIYGENYEFRISSSKSCGTEVFLSIPAEAAGEDSTCLEFY